MVLKNVLKYLGLLIKYLVLFVRFINGLKIYYFVWIKFETHKPVITINVSNVHENEIGK